MTQWLPTVNWFEMSELPWHAIKGKVLGRQEWVCSVQTKLRGLQKQKCILSQA